MAAGERASYNYYRILRSIWQNRAISRAELANRHQLDKTTVSQIVSELTEQGLVEVLDVDTTNPKPGRKSELLSVNPRWGVVVGIEVRPEGINACATDVRGGIIATHHHVQSIDRARLRDAFHRSLEGIRADDRVQGMPLIGVGCAVSGLVNRESGTILRSIPLGIHDPYDFQSQVAAEIEVPVWIDNDANSCAWGQLVHGESQTPSNFVYVLVVFRPPSLDPDGAGAIGLGLGYVIGDTVYYGSNGVAGEFRSIFWHPGYRNQFGIPDNEADGILDKPGSLPRLVDEMASNIAMLANSLDLGAIYVGGDVEPIKDLLIGSFESAIRNNWPYETGMRCSVELSDLEGDIVSAGAAGMVLEHLFSEPALADGLRAKNDNWKAILAVREAEMATNRDRTLLHVSHAAGRRNHG